MVAVNLALRALPLLNKGSKIAKKTPKKGAGLGGGLSTLIAAAPLINLVSSVAKATTGIASGVAKSMGRAVSGTEEEAERRANADNGDTTPSINTEGAPVDFDEETPEMFGGLDLAKVKSTLDDEGPMGPPEPEAPTVYKRMIQVLKTMAETLLRMEATMKMLLAIEYERVKGMTAQSTAESIASAQTPDPGDNETSVEKRGILGAGKDMLGSAWKKAKDSPTWLKMLGLAGLLGAIKFWKEDLEKAVAKILEWLTKTYEYFTAEDFSFAKIADDFKNKFMPKIYSVVDNILGSVWEYIKATIFGARGDLRIQQEAGDASVSKKSMTTLTDKAIAGGDKLSDMRFHEGAFGVIHLSGADTLESSEVRKLHSSIKDHMGVMNEISKQSDGRIQWDTFPGYNFGEGFLNSKNFDDAFKTHPVASFINANPVIDGVPYENWDILKDINLDAMAGITKGMGEDRANKIRKVLARKTQAFQSNKSQDSLHEEYLALEPELLPKLTTGASIVTDGTSDSGQKLKDAEKQTPTGVNAPFINAITSDNSSTTTVTQNATVPLNGKNDHITNALLNEALGFSAKTGVITI